MNKLANKETESIKPIDKLKNILAAPTVAEQLKNAMGEHRDLFVASLIDLYANDIGLARCEPKAVVMEALKAATLRLPLNKALGFAYLVVYDKNTKTSNGWEKIATPQMQIGYKGILQLAQRTGQYKHINADRVLEGELISRDKLTGMIDISGDPISDKVIGYFAHIETITGFKATTYWEIERVKKHAERYSSSYKSAVAASKDPSKRQPKSVIWIDNFDEMAIKTALKQLISRYGAMSIEINYTIAKEDYEESNIANSELINFGEVNAPAIEAEKDVAQAPSWAIQGDATMVAE